MEFQTLAILCLLIVEGLLIWNIRQLNRQLKQMNKNLYGTLEVVENKLHAIVDKINFDIPKIMEQGLKYLEWFRNGK